MSLTNHSMAVDTRDNVWGWGFNRYGQLGNGRSDDVNLTPELVMWPVDANVAPEPFALTHVSASDENGDLLVEQTGFHVMIHAEFGASMEMFKDITLKFTDVKKQNIFAGIGKDDVRIMEDRYAIAFGSHMHMDFKNDPENQCISLGIKLRDKENYDIPKTIKLRFVNTYNEFGMPLQYDIYYITLVSE